MLDNGDRGFLSVNRLHSFSSQLSLFPLFSELTSNTELIIIAVVAGIGGLLLLLLVCGACYVFCRNPKYTRHRRSSTDSSAITVAPHPPIIYNPMGVGLYQTGPMYQVTPNPTPRYMIQDPKSVIQDPKYMIHDDAAGAQPPTQSLYGTVFQAQ